MSLDDLIARGELVVAANAVDGVIQLKTAATFDEPVELTGDEARELAARLIALADALD